MHYPCRKFCHPQRYLDLTIPEKIEYIKTIVSRIIINPHGIQFEFKKPFKDILKVSSEIKKATIVGGSPKWVADGA
jgi:hypothetical protein